MLNQHKYNFIKVNLLIIIILISFKTYANTYYFANNGSNSYTAEQAQNMNTPWKTLDKLNSLTLNPGDKVLFKRGDIFIGKLNINSSGNVSNKLYFGAYGSGNKPLIKGSKVITSWKMFSDDIWSASKATFSNKVHSVFIKNIFQPIGRFPNSGYRKISSNNGQIQITDNDLNNPAGFWNKGVIVFKSRRCILI